MDLSPTARKGLRYAMQLPADLIGCIWLLYVQQPNSFLSGVETSPLVRSDAEAGQSERHILEGFLRREVPPLQRGGTLIRIGAPDLEIVQAAQELGIDLIVMTTHGYHGLQHMIHPSISERVIRNAPCPVLTVNNAMLEHGLK
jgi:nucleotide-binding universal stress UspA family protein